MTKNCMWSYIAIASISSMLVAVWLNTDVSSNSCSRMIQKPQSRTDIDFLETLSNS